jgi:hypothetical protein
MSSSSKHNQEKSSILVWSRLASSSSSEFHKDKVCSLYNLFLISLVVLVGRPIYMIDVLSRVSSE